MNHTTSSGMNSNASTVTSRNRPCITEAPFNSGTFGVTFSPAAACKRGRRRRDLRLDGVAPGIQLDGLAGQVAAKAEHDAQVVHFQSIARRRHLGTLGLLQNLGERKRMPNSVTSMLLSLHWSFQGECSMKISSSQQARA